MNVNRQERLWLAWTALVLVLAANLPYLIGWAATPADAHFTGLVFNPIDGHSYLAKMRQGFDGSWRFRLAFTPEQSPGAHIFLFHLWLGHLARWIGPPLIAVYHGARILGGIAMLLVIYSLASRLSDQRRERGTMFLLTVLGSGVGWLLLPAGIRTADVWVAEAFPAYSLMANAHFPLAIALMAGIAVCGLRLLEIETEREEQGGTVWATGLGLMLASMLLGAIQPFGLVPAFGGLGITLVAQTLRERSIPRRTVAWIAAAGALGLPYPLYMQVAIRSDPLLAAWNAQNVTPSPPPWDWALSYGLVLVLAAWGGSVAVRRGSNGDVLLLSWILVTMIGMTLPLPLQRRLSLGLAVPLGLLAGMGWWHGARKLIRPRARSLARRLVIAVSALTPVFLMATVSAAALGPEASRADSWLYLSDGEWGALQWLREQAEAEPDAVVLCAPQMGSFIPAWTGLPVVYGHPFETLNADSRRALVEDYWTGAMRESQEEEFLNRNRVVYILIGPREREVMVPNGGLDQGAEPIDEDSHLVFESGTVKVYELTSRERRP